MRRTVIAFLICVAPLVCSCSENDTAPVLDVNDPEVILLYPRDTTPDIFIVSDSIDTYLAAHDVGTYGRDGAPATVELWFTDPGRSGPVRVGTMSQPITLDGVPADLRPFIALPAGWSLYTRRWYTGATPLPPIGTPINFGAEVQLFAVAYDEAGNRGRTGETVVVRVLNSCGPCVSGPSAAFAVSPSAGTTVTVFTFDAGFTTDWLDPLHAIRVRWDFDGTPANGWDVDWDRDARADEPQTRQFAAAGRRRIVLQAHNSYVPDMVTEFTRELDVRRSGNDTAPPEPENYALVPAGTYVIGDTSYVLDGRSFPCDANEGPIHEALISTPFLIEKTEVTNRLYLSFLEMMLETDPPEIVLGDGVIVAHQLGDSPDTTSVYLVLERSSIFFDMDSRALAIAAGYEEHPVTGVTGPGANAYALAYGLRLPTESEWEVAARGHNVLFDYPFADGTELSAEEGPRRANYAGARSATDPFAGITTPRRFFDGGVHGGFRTDDSPSVFGLYDQAGNVAEWVSDWAGEYPSRLTLDPQGPQYGEFKIVRGGSYLGSRAGIRCTARQGLPPGQGYLSVGFRTAFNSP